MMRNRSWLAGLAGKIFPRRFAVAKRAARRQQASSSRRTLAISLASETLEPRHLLTVDLTLLSPELDGSSGWDVAAGDITGDGYADIVVAEDTITSVWINNQDNTFTETVQSAGGLLLDNDGHIALGDFNSDGHLDAISGAKIYLNDTTGTGTFNTFDTPNTVIGQGIGGIAIGDVDEDGLLDCAVASDGDISVWTDWDQSTNTFLTTTTLSSQSGIRSIDLASLDPSDGNSSLDLFVSCAASSSNTIYLNANDGEGGFNLHDTIDTGDSDGAALGDFTGDGINDAFIAGDNTVLSNDGFGNFEEITQTSSLSGYSRDVAVGDIDQDGHLDVIGVNGGGSHRVWLNSAGNGVFTPDLSFGGATAYGVALVDIDNDTDLDVVMVEGSTRIWRNNLDPVTNEPPVATGETGFVNANASLIVAAPGVLGNDTDPENDTLTAVLVDDVQHGNLTLSADGSFTYTPVNGYFGSDSFTYRADDGTNQSDVATVSLSVSNLIRTFDDPTPTTSDEFGIGVKITADYILVGAAADDTNATDSGQAFLFDAHTGSLLHTFNDPAMAASSNFGHVLDIDGDNVLIASTRDDSLGTDVGRVYLFDAVSGNLLHTFDDPTVTTSDEFGWSVAIEGNHVVVGAHFDDTNGTNVGQVHLFDASTGNFVRTFDDPSVSGEDKFGWSVDIEGDWLLVGSSEDNDEGATGRDSEAYLFDINTGTHLRTFIDPTHTTSDGFGENVVLSGNHVFISDHGDDTGGDGVGQVHQFDASTGNLVRTYDNPNPDASDYFGNSLSVEGNHLIAGAFMDDAPDTDAGQAYLFDITSGSLLQTFSDPTPTAAGYFGASVAIYSNHAVVGAHHDNLQGAGVGQVHLFSLGPNEAPTGVSLTGTTTSLAEDADTSSAVKVADIVVADDGEGTNTISLTGADAASFEVVGTELFLAAGTALDYETKTSYVVTVNVEDSSVAGSTPVTVDYTLTITDVPDVSIVTTQQGSEADNSDTIFTLTRTGDLSGELTVNMILQGTAEPGVDYTAPAGVINVTGDAGDGQLGAAGEVQGLSVEHDRAGVGGDNSRGLGLIYFFELPTLPAGTTLTGAELQLQYTQIETNAAPDFNLDLYGLDARDTATFSASDYVDGNTSSPSDTLIESAIVTPTTDPGKLSISNANLDAFLASLYNEDGTPTATYATFRVNADTNLPPGSGTARGYWLAFRDHTTESFRPQLNLATTQAVTFAAGVTTATVSLPTLSDSVVDPYDSIWAVLRSGTGYTIQPGADRAAAVLTAENIAATLDHNFDRGYMSGNADAFGIWHNVGSFAALKADGSIHAWGRSEDFIQAPTDSGYVQIFSSASAQAAIKADGSIFTWGYGPDGGTGGPTEAGYASIFSNAGAMGAMRPDGSIVTWGQTPSGGTGNTGVPAGGGYVQVASTGTAFAALNVDGTIASWGTFDNPTDPPSDSGYVRIISAQDSFAAIKADGSVVSWGDGNEAGSGAPTGTGYVQVEGAGNRFAALHADGTVTSWGVANSGSDAPTDNGYLKIFTAPHGFVAMKEDGSLSAWGNSAAVNGAPVDSGYVQVYSNGHAFAAIKEDGTLASWGNPDHVGDGAPARGGYTQIVSTEKAFAALNVDSSISTWGHVDYGASGGPTDSGYTQLTATEYAFAAMKEDGTIFAWGDGFGGGMNGSTGYPTDSGYVAFSNPLMDDVLAINEAPTDVSLANTVTSLAEDHDTTSAVKLADIIITDDGHADSINTISLTGTDAASFEVVGTELFLVAGTALDYETKTSYAVTVSVEDSSVAGSTPATVDYTLAIDDVDEYDYGDVPAPYPVTQAEGGAEHLAVGPTLGSTRDVEADGTHSAAADADGADEDGVTFGAIQVGALDAQVTVNVQNAPSGAKLDGWLDFNADGNWGGHSEHVLMNVDVTDGDNLFTFDVPSWSAVGTTYARFRLSSAGNLGIGGFSADGEVEDYVVNILAPASGSGIFSEQIVISTNTLGTYHAVPVDFDGDGDMDIVQGSINDDTISWFENDGSENFSERIISTNALRVFRVDPIDVDGDGDLDVLSASWDDNKIAWHETLGNGSFSENVISTSVTNAHAVVAEDMDGDGDYDVLSGSNDGDVNLHLNDGQGTFTTSIITNVSKVRSIHAIDIDRDGDLDLLTTGDGYWLHRNDGSLNFTKELVVDAFANHAVTADIDMDGDPDIVGPVHSGEGTLAWFEQNGGVFTEHTIAQHTSDIVFVGDMDGDGDPDILAESNADTNSAVYLYTNNTQTDPETDEITRIFTETIISSGINLVSSVFGSDIDGDGDLDVISTSNYEHKLAWYKQITNLAPTDVSLTGTVASLPEDTDTTSAIKVADIVITDDGVGTNTITPTGTDAASFEVVGNELRLVAGTVLDYETKTSYAVTVNVADSSVAGSTPVTVDFALAITDVDDEVLSGVVFDDTNGDGSQGVGESGLAGWTVYLDANDDGVLDGGEVTTTTLTDDPATAETNEAGSYSFTGLTASQYTVRIVVQSDWVVTSPAIAEFISGDSVGVNALISADFNGDGVNDLAGTAGVVLSDGQGGFGDATALGISLIYIASGDIDNDGDIDLAAANMNDLAVMLNDGQGAFAAPVFYSVFGHGGKLAINDVNDDGNLDLLVMDYGAEDGLVVTLGDGTGTFGTPSNYATGGYESDLIVVGDYDLDGNIDAVVMNHNSSGSSEIAFLPNTGQTPLFQHGHSYSINATYTQYLEQADIDGDGDLDILASATTSNTIRIFENDGSGGFGTTTTYSDLSYAKFGDMDNDGDQDILAQTSTSSGFMLFTNDGSGNFSSPVSVVDVAGGGRFVIDDLDDNGRPDVTVEGSVYLNQIDQTPSQTATASASGLDFGVIQIANEAPTDVALTGTVTSLPEDTDTTSPIKVGDIVIADDGHADSDNAISLEGADANDFDVVGTELFLKAGTALDYETKASYSVTVEVVDNGVSGSTPVTVDYTLAITDVNEAPTDVSLANEVISLPEDTDTSSAVKVADIAITDDALGTNTMNLTGADANDFDVVGTELQLKAGTALDYETKTSYSVTVEVVDNGLGGSPVTVDYTLAIDDVNESVVAIAVTQQGDEADNSDSILTLTRTGVLSGPLTVNLVLLGSAKAGVDYTAPVGLGGDNTLSVDFADGESTATVSLQTLSDAVIDPLESIQAILQSGSGYNIAPGQDRGIAYLGAEGISVDIDMRDSAHASSGIKTDGEFTKGGSQAANRQAFTALNANGTVASWGTMYGDPLEESANGFTQVVPSASAFAGLKNDGSVVSWGSIDSGIPSDSGYVALYSNAKAFAALKPDGSLTIWGSTDHAGGVTPENNIGFVRVVVAPRDFTAIRADGTLWSSMVGYPTEGEFIAVTANKDAFTALKSDGSLVYWGIDGGVRSDALPTETGFERLYSNPFASVGMKADGSIKSWGYQGYGGNDTAPTGSGFVSVVPTYYAFAALKNDGSVTSWGNEGHTNSSAPVDTGFVQLVATDTSFAALKDDGTIAAWGNDFTGGLNAPVESGFVRLFASGSAFAALKADGSIVSWGDGSKGGSGAPGDTGFVDVIANQFAFAAVKSDGSITAWGDGTYGGSGAPAGTGFVDFAMPKPQFDLGISNLAPTDVALTNTVTSLAEDTDTSSAVKVADIAITDDALGTNAISLTGTDKDSFQVVGTELQLKAGTALDYETKTSYAVTVSVLDSTVSGSTPVTVDFALAITDVNEAPTDVSLTGTVASLPEDTDTTSAIKVADIVITDDGVGTNTITPTGTDAASFAVVGTELQLVAGTALDYETKTSYSVTVSVQDSTVAGSTPVTVDYTLTITDVNDSVLSGTVFEDVNSDGMRDAEDIGLAGWTVFLDANQSGALDEDETSTTTLADDPVTTGVVETGTYAFSGLAATEHTVRIVIPQNWAVTYPVIGEFITGSTVNLTVLATADLNSDGAIDLVGTAGTALNQGDGSFGEISSLDVSIDHLATGDIDNDGDIDIVTSKMTNVYIFENDGQGNFSQSANLNITSHAGEIALADVNSDNNLDLIVVDRHGDSHTGNDHIVVLLGDGTGAFGAPNEYSTGGNQPGHIVMGDYDGDDDIDAVVMNHNGTSLSHINFLENDGTGQFTAGPNYGIGANYTNELDHADIDGDGDLDILASHTTLSTAVIFENDGSGGFDTSTTLNDLGRAQFGDFDADGDQDILAKSTSTEFVLLENDGAGNFDLPRTLTGTSGDHFAIADLNNSGWLDFTSGNTVYFNQNIGNPYHSVVATSTDVDFGMVRLNGAPTDVSLANTVTSLPEDTDTSAAIKIADIVITDDGLGANDIGLSESDADDFDVVGTELFLVAGTALDYETKTSYSVTVSVEDTTVDGSSTVTVDYTLLIDNVNDGPTGTVSISGTPTEDETLTASHTLADEDGLGAISLQWNRSGVAIGGATSSTYTLTQLDVGSVITVTASYTDNEGTDESVTSDATAPVANVNDAPTGTVTISGTATEDETLTVSHTLADEDGLGAITLQWNRDGSAIDGATGSSYSLTQLDVGSVITVTASYTDNEGTDESVTSDATAPVANVNDLPSGTVVISGTATEDETLTAAHTLADEDGLGAVSLQWKRSGVAIGGATSSTYTLTQLDVGSVITVTASYTDNEGTDESVTSDATAPVANVNDAPTGAVVISGTPTEDETLTAAHTLADEDGLGAVGLQWFRGGVAIGGANSSTYTLVQEDVGSQITVTASYTDNQSTAESVSSDPTEAVANVNDAPTGTVTISGTPTEDQVLTASNTLADEDGLGAVSLQWRRDGGAIDGATSSTYTLTQEDVGSQITVTASYTDNQSTAESVTSDPTEAVANVNDAPSGTVTISGTPTEDQVLTAAHTLADEDGLGPISLQWRRDGGAIGGATSSTYTLTQADVGSAITVTASYTDNQSTAESVTSDPTTAVANVNDAPSGTVTISGTPTEDQVLTAAHTLADEDGLGAVSLQWRRDGGAIGGATSSTYTLTQADVGSAITVTASYTDNQSTAESVTSDPTAAVANVNDAPSGTVTISGTPTEDQVLTANNTLADEDGLGAVSLQWRRDGGAIGGATSSTYTLVQEDVGSQITVTASYTDNQSTAESVTSDPTSAVANVNDAPSGTVTISGTPTEDQVLTANNTLADEDGLGAISLQWKRSGVAIGGATSSTYTLTQADVGSAITVTASYTDNQSTAESVTSDPTSAVANVNDAPTGAVVISGTPTEDQVLTAAHTLADEDGLGAVSLQWRRDGGAIGGATSSTYTLTQADVGSAITVTASYTDNQSTAESVTSDPTAAVANVNDAPSGTVTISGTPTEDQVLTANNTLADEDGLGAVSLQWRRDGGAIGGATSSTYTLVQEDVGSQITVTASYTDNQSTAESVTSDPTTAVANVNDAPSGTVTISGTPTEDQVLTANNTLADEDGLGAIGLQWNRSGTPISGATSSSYTLTQVDVGAQITVTASYTDNQSTAESVTSDPTTAVANVNDAPTGAVVISGTPTEGQVLTAAHTLADEDGLGAVSLQWRRDGGAIGGATSSTYALVQEDVGSQITVTASYTDNQSTAESVTSDPTSAVTNNMVIFAYDTSADQLVNGAFEGSPVSNNSWGHVAAISGWTSSNGVEVWGEGFANYATAGRAGTGIRGQVVELDYYGGGALDWIEQGVATGAGAEYLVLVDVLSRTGSGVSDDMELSWNGTVFDAAHTSELAGQSWQSYGGLVTGSGGTDALRLAETAASNDGYGPVIDNARVYQATSPTVDEGLPGGTVVTNIHLSTVDGVAYTNLRLSHDAGGLFTLDADTGVIRTTRSLDFDSDPSSYQLTVAVDTAGGTLTKTLSVGLNETNQAPTAVALVNTVTTLSEGADTSSRIKVADLQVTDDGVGSNTASLSGPDAASFEVDGTELFLKAGTGLDYDSQASYSVTVNVEDGTVSGSTPVTASLTLSITEGNQPPTGVALANAVASLPEDTDTTSAVKLADIQITDDALGTNDITLSGSDATSFEVDGTELFLKAGTGLDRDSQASYSVTINVEDSSLPSSTPVTVDYTLAITNVNDSPSGTVVISGTATEDETLTASNTLADADGLGAISYHWRRDGSTIGGATNSTYTLTQADVGAQITVTASYTDGEGTAESVTSDPTSAVVNVDHQPVLSDASPAMAGISEDPGVPVGAVGTLVSALIDTGGPLDNYTDADGDAPAIAITDVNLGGGTLYYSIDNGANWADVGTVSEASARVLHADSGTRLAFTPAADFHGAIGDLLTIKAWDRTGGYANGAGSVDTTAMTATSIATDTVSSTVTPVNDAPTGTVTITGTPTEDETLTASNTLADAEGLGATSYQWRRDGGDIGGATNSTYTLTQEDVGSQITVTASYTDGEGTPESVTSDPTSAVADINDAPTGVVLANTVSSLPEDTDTTSAVKLADIVIADDGHAGSNNVITLSGSDATSFEVDGTELFLKAGTALDRDSQTSYSVTVNVEDRSVSGSTPVTAELVLEITSSGSANLSLFAYDTSANQLVGGTFEGSGVSNNSWGHVAAISGWTSSNGVEVWGEGFANYATSGRAGTGIRGQVVELDYYGGGALDWIEQGVATGAGAEYLVLVDVLSRTGSGVSDDMELSWNGTVFDTAHTSELAGQSWQSYGGLVTGSGGTAALRLAETAASNDGYGPVIDNARVYQATSPTVDEGLPGETVVTNIHLSTVDGVAYTNLRLSHDAGGLFTLDADTGVIRTTRSLDFDSDPSSYQLTVAVDTAGGTLTKTLSVGLNETNQAPTAVTLVNTVTTLSEAADTSSRIKVADLQITDDALGTNDVTLSGSDAASFEVDGTELFLKAGTGLDRDSQASYAVTVNVEDSSLAGSTPVTVAYTLAITDINDAPTGVVLANTVASLAEDTDTTSAVKLADIVIADDGHAGSNNVITLSGSDATRFEVVGTELCLKAGTGLDRDSQASYSITVNVEDSSLADSTPVTAELVLAITPPGSANLSLFAYDTSANQLVNGALEGSGVSNNSWGHVAAISGWTSSNGVEVWGEGFANYATSGRAGTGIRGQLVELDYYGGGALDWIEQGVATGAGAEYLVLVDVLSRTGSGVSDDMELSWNGTVFDTAHTSELAGQSWQSYGGLVTGSGGTDALRLAETAASNDGYGPVIDNARVYQATSPTVDEGLPGETVVTNIHLSTVDGVAYTNLRLSHDAGGLFTLDADTGVIRTTRSLDFDSDPSSYQLTVAVDTAGGTLTKTLSVGLNEITTAPRGSAYRAMQQASQEQGFSRASLEAIPAGRSLEIASALDYATHVSDTGTLSTAGSTLALSTVTGSTVALSSPGTADLAFGEDELDDVLATLEDDWQQAFGSEGENPFTGF